MMDLHPSDTRQVFNEFRNHLQAHLWYQVHYNQLKNRDNYKRKEINSFDVHPIIQKLGTQVNEQRISALLELSNVCIRKLKAKLTKSIVHGLGAEHVRESSFSIHPVYGFPYIPGSSIKGLVRSWFIEAFLDGDETQFHSSDRQLAEVGREIFGIQDEQGVVQFFDSYIFNHVKISSDIMTPHFSDYYGGIKAASDTLSPVPISFYTVKVPEIEFLFLIRGGRNSKYPKEIIGNMVSDWTKNALVEFGLGAKTSSGYGFFQEVIDVTEQELQKKIDEKIRLEEEKRKELQIQKKKVEVEKRRKAEQEKLEKMSPQERLIYQLESLNEQNTNDIERSKTELYEQVIESKDKQAALALKTFWEKTNDWNVKKKQKKQYNKVMNIQNLIE